MQNIFSLFPAISDSSMLSLNTLPLESVNCGPVEFLSCHSPLYPLHGPNHISTASTGCMPTTALSACAIASTNSTCNALDRSYNVREPEIGCGMIVGIGSSCSEGANSESLVGCAVANADNGPTGGGSSSHGGHGSCAKIGKGLDQQIGVRESSASVGMNSPGVSCDRTYYGSSHAPLNNVSSGSFTVTSEESVHCSAYLWPPVAFNCSRPPVCPSVPGLSFPTHAAALADSNAFPTLAPPLFSPPGQPSTMTAGPSLLSPFCNSGSNASDPILLVGIASRDLKCYIYI